MTFHAFPAQFALAFAFWLALALTLVGAAVGGAQTAQASPQNVNISGAVDLVAPMSLDDDQNNRLGVRGAEVLLFGPIDHLFDGMLNVAGHRDSDAFEFDLHEAFVSSSKLIPRSRVRVGKFLLSVGRLNQFHQHDWPFVTAPKVHREFLNPGAGAYLAESAMDTGVEYAWLAPTDRFLEVVVGATNGYCFGHCHKESGRPPAPVHYAHPSAFFELDDGGGLLLGATYLARKSSSNEKTTLIGIDATYKKRVGRRLKWLVQSEAFYQKQSPAQADDTDKAGFYVYPEYGFENQMSFGVRVDGFSHLNKTFESTGEKRGDFDYALVPTLTYRPSEFSTLRLAYSHEVDTTQGSGDALDRQIQLQFVYLMGAHPAHEF